MPRTRSARYAGGDGSSSREEPLSTRRAMWQGGARMTLVSIRTRARPRSPYGARWRTAPRRTPWSARSAAASRAAFKLSAQHIEDDIDFALKVGVDYIILDGRGGGTGAGSASKTCMLDQRRPTSTNVDHEATLHDPAPRAGELSEGGGHWVGSIGISGDSAGERLLAGPRCSSVLFRRIDPSQVTTHLPFSQCKAKICARGRQSPPKRYWIHRSPGTSRILKTLSAALIFASIRRLPVPFFAMGVIVPSGHTTRVKL